MTTVVITVSGGIVRSVQSDDENLRFVVLDEDFDSLDPPPLVIEQGKFKGEYGTTPWVSHPEYVNKGELENLLNLIEEHEQSKTTF